MKNGFLQHLNPWQKVLFYFLMLVFFVLLTGLLEDFLRTRVFQVEVSGDLLPNLARIDVIRWNKVLNFIFHVLVFIVPSIVFMKCVSTDPQEFCLSKKPERKWWWMTPFLFVIFLFINGLLYWVNHSIDFSFISEDLETSFQYEQAVHDKLIYAYVGTTWKSYVVNIFLLALVPAIGEELTFRGVLQHLFSKTSKSIHFGAIASAGIFALIHAQPYNFLPIFALGLAYGYLVAYTGSIWITILLHFANNALQVTLLHLARIYNWESTENYLYLDLLFFLVAVVILVLFLRKNPQISRWNQTKGIYLR